MTTAPALLTGTVLYGDEFLQSTPIANAPIIVRQLVGGVTATSTVGGPTERVLTDQYGHWAVTLIPSITETPNSVVELTTPTMGTYRVKPPLTAGSYKAITQRDDTL